MNGSVVKGVTFRSVQYPTVIGHGVLVLEYPHPSSSDAAGLNMILGKRVWTGGITTQAVVFIVHSQQIVACSLAGWSPMKIIYNYNSWLHCYFHCLVQFNNKKV